MANKKKALTQYASWVRKSPTVNSLKLDPNNVRLELNDQDVGNIDQGSIINDLFVNEEAFEILESIVLHGWFADESPIVVKEGSKYVVIEGNRRVAALKVLQNPHLVPAYFAKVKPLADSVIPIKNVNVLVAPNRDAAITLIASKHTNPTLRPWRRLRQAHFYYSQLSPKVSVADLKKKFHGVDIEKYIKMAEIHTIAASLDFGDELVNNKVRQQRSFPVSTLERLYNDQGFKNRLNFEFKDSGEIQILSKKTSFDGEFKKVVLDAVEKKIDTRKLNTEKDRKDYYAKRVKKLTKGNQKTKTNKYQPKPVVKPPKKSKRGIFPKSIANTIDSPAIGRVLEELQKIGYATYPNATHDLLRSFLEASLKAYLKKKGAPVKANSPNGYVYFKTVLIAAQKYFKDVKNKQMEQIVNTIIKDKDFYDAINHNPSIFSTEQKVKEAADQAFDLVKFIFEDYGS